MVVTINKRYLIDGTGGRNWVLFEKVSGRKKPRVLGGCGVDPIKAFAALVEQHPGRRYAARRQS